MRLRLDLIEHKTKKGFYQVPSKPDFYVSKTGEVLDTVIGDIAEQRLGEYIRVVDGGKHTHLHRMLAETFLEQLEDVDPDEQVVNHIDGIKWNNELSNLEWTTESGNSLHAYQTGLRDDNRVVESKDIRTGEVKRFFSLRDCADHFKSTTGRIHWCVKPERCKMIHFSHYLLRDVENPWPNIEEVIAAHMRPAEVKEILVMEKEPKKTIVFGTIKMAAEYLGVTPDTVTMKLKRALNAGLDRTEINNRLVMYFGNYKDSLEDVEFRKWLHHRVGHDGPGNRKPIPILVNNLKTGEEVRYNSSEEFAKVLGVPKNTLQKHILVNDGVWKKSFRVSYLNKVLPSSNTSAVTF